MLQPVSSSTKALGFWTATMSTVFSVAYIIGQLAEWLGWLGSQGGPESSSTALGIIILLTPSFFLGSAFLILMVCVHQLAIPHRKVWSHTAIAFATAYAVLTGLVYYVQLTLVVPRMLKGQPEGLEPFQFVPFDSFFYSADLLGYSFMSVATLFAAQVFVGSGMERKARWFLTANGLLLPFLALQIYYHPLIWIAALWLVTFPGATWTLALIFRKIDLLPTDPNLLG